MSEHSENKHVMVMGFGQTSDDFINHFGVTQPKDKAVIATNEGIIFFHWNDKKQTTSEQIKYARAIHELVGLHGVVVFETSCNDDSSSSLAVAAKGIDKNIKAHMAFTTSWGNDGHVLNFFPYIDSLSQHDHVKKLKDVLNVPEQNDRQKTQSGLLEIENNYLTRNPLLGLPAELIRTFPTNPSRDMTGQLQKLDRQ